MGSRKQSEKVSGLSSETVIPAPITQFLYQGTYPKGTTVSKREPTVEDQVLMDISHSNCNMKIPSSRV